MKRNRFSEEQIIGILKEAEAGAKKQALCRQHGISEQTFYRWRAKYGGLRVSEAKKLKGLETENRKLKQLLAEAHLDNAALKELLSKTGKARCTPSSCDPSGRAWDVEPAAGLSARGSPPVGSQSPAPAWERCCTARAAESRGCGVSPIWLQDAARNVEDRRAGCEPEEDVPDLSGGATPGAAQAAQTPARPRPMPLAPARCPESAVVETSYPTNWPRGGAFAC